MSEARATRPERGPLAQKNMRGLMAVVVGSAVSGLSAAKLLRALGASVRLLERDAERLGQEVLAELEKLGLDVRLGEHRVEDFQGADLVVLSPGIQAAKIRPLLPEDKALEPDFIMSELELAWTFSDAPVLAVTGTNGKTTTVTLAAEMLRASGYNVFLGGNIGTPLSDYVLSRLNGAPRVDVLVLEVSSFQLQNCLNFSPEVAVLINFSPNHLDWHTDMDEYLAAKLNLFARQRPLDLALLPREFYQNLPEGIPGQARIEFLEDVSLDGLEAPRLPGPHNRANILAAYAAASYFGLNEQAVRAMLAHFRGLPNRQEYVGEIRGVAFVNDSKATTVDSLRAALEAMDRPVRLLAGGVFKGGDLSSLLPLLREKVRQVGLFGASREVFEEAWAGQVPMMWSKDLETAVRALFEQAREHEVILLSPATASFDLYKDYKARGDDFRRIFEVLS